MPLPLTVNHGELIRADVMTDILAFLRALDSRVSTLEATSGSSTGLVISSIIPSGPIRVGEEMSILGQNFGFGIGAHRVFVDGMRVLIFKNGSSDQKLVFDIPDVPNVPTAGKPAVMSVSNQTATEIRTLNLLPQQIALGGVVDINFDSVQPQTISAGAQATFRYRIRSRANQTAQFPITATISGVPNVSDWQNVVRIFNDDNSENTARTITLEPLQESFFKVRLTTVPATPANATFTLAATVTATGVTATPDSRPFTVNQAVEQPDPTMSISFQNAIPVAAFSSGTIRVARLGAAQVSFLGVFTVTGNYTINHAITNGTGWTIEFPGQLPTLLSQSFTVSSADLQNPPHQRLFSFIVRAQAAASATGKAEFRIERAGGGKQIFPASLAVNV